MGVLLSFLSKADILFPIIIEQNIKAKSTFFIQKMPPKYWSIRLIISHILNAQHSKK